MACVCDYGAGLLKRSLHIYPNLLRPIKCLAGRRRYSPLASNDCFARNVHMAIAMHSCGIISE